MGEKHLIAEIIINLNNNLLNKIIWITQDTIWHKKSQKLYKQNRYINIIAII